MKYIKYAVFLFATVLINSCDEEEILSYALQEISAPSKVTAAFDITQDDTGLVTITPSGEGVSTFTVYFGADPNETGVEVGPGSSVQNTYTEGEYTVRVVGTGATGLTSEFARTIVISFRVPENLVSGIVQDVVNPAMITVAPTADFASEFDIYFGEDPNADPITIMAGEATTYTYAGPGEYEVRIVAMSLSVNTEEITQVVTIPDASDPVTFPIDFESFTVNYALIAFGPDGNFASVIDNPLSSGVNTSPRVAAFEKIANSEVWAGTVVTLEEPIDFSTNTLIKMKFYSPSVGFAVTMKIENLTDGLIFHEVISTTTVADEWEELTFDFSAINTANTYQKVVLFFNFGTAGDGSIYYFDDIIQTSSSSCIAESTENIDPSMGDINWTFQTNDIQHAFEPFGDIASEIVANPLQDNVNSSCNVQKYSKTFGCQTWSGVGKGLANAIDLSTNTNRIFGMKVLAETQTTEVTLRLEFEPFPNVDPAVDVVQTISQVGVWEELFFDFSAHADKTFKSVIVYFDRNQACDGAVYYFDDIVQYAEIPVDCDDEMTANVDPAMGNIDWTFQGGMNAFDLFGNISGGIVTNPLPDAVNYSCNVMKYDKTPGCETWSGSGIGLTNAIDLTSTMATSFSMKVYAETHTTDVTLRLEFEPFPNTEPSAEVVQPISSVGQWEELTFDFSAHTDKTFKSIIVYFDRNQPCDGAVYYFDDIKQFDPAVCIDEPSSNIDPAIGDIDWTFKDGLDAFDLFGNITGGIVDNPVLDVVNRSCYVQKYDKVAGCETWSGAGIGLTNAIDLTTSPNKKFTLKVLAETHVTDVTLRLEFEPFPNTEPSADVVQSISSVGQWEELTFDFSAHADKTFKSIIIYFDRNQPCDGAVYYFDDLKQIN